MALNSPRKALLVSLRCAVAFLLAVCLGCGGGSRGTSDQGFTVRFALKNPLAQPIADAIIKLDFDGREQRTDAAGVAEFKNVASDIPSTVTVSVGDGPGQVVAQTEPAVLSGRVDLVFDSASRNVVIVNSNPNPTATPHASPRATSTPVVAPPTPNATPSETATPQVTPSISPSSSPTPTPTPGGPAQSPTPPNVPTSSPTPTPTAAAQGFLLTANQNSYQSNQTAQFTISIQGYPPGAFNGSRITLVLGERGTGSATLSFANGEQITFPTSPTDPFYLVSLQSLVETVSGDEIVFTVPITYVPSEVRLFAQAIIVRPQTAELLGTTNRLHIRLGP